MKSQTVPIYMGYSNPRAEFFRGVGTGIGISLFFLGLLAAALCHT